MGVRPPQSNDDDGPEVIEFGIPEVAAELDAGDVSFPATGREVVRALSDPRIDYDTSGHTVSLSEAVGELDQEEFESREAFLNALHPVFEEYRRSRTPSVLERVRAALPL